MAYSKSGVLVAVWLVMKLLFLLFVGLSWKVSNQFLIECRADHDKLCAKTRRSASFAALWMTFMALVLSVGGNLALRKYRNSMALGVFIGVSLMMANWFLVTAVDFANIVIEKKEAIDQINTGESGDLKVHFRLIIEGAAALSTVLAFMYAVFAALLVYFRVELLRGAPHLQEDDDGDTYELSPHRRCVVVQADGLVKPHSFGAAGDNETSSTNRSLPSQDKVRAAMAVV